MQKSTFLLLLLCFTTFSAIAQWVPAISPTTYAISGIVSQGDTVVVSTYEPVAKFYLSTNAGQSWADISDPMVGEFYLTKIVGGKVYAYNFNDGVAVYADGQWTLRNNGLQTYQGSYYIYSMDASNGWLLVGNLKNEADWLYVSNDEGLHWTAVSASGLHPGYQALYGYFAGSRIYSQGINSSSNSKPEAYYSDDFGQSWHYLPVGGQAGQVYSLHFNETRSIVLVEGLTNKYLHQGDSLVLAAGLPTGGQVYWIAESDSRLFLKLDQQTWLSSDGGLHWSVTNQVPDIYQLSTYGALLVGITTQNTLVVSSDHGDTWAPFGTTNIVPPTFGGTLYPNSNQLFFISIGKAGFYRFDPVINDWEARNNGIEPSSAYFVRISTDGPKAWVYSWLGSFTSQDAGQTWQELSADIWDFQKIGNQYYARSYNLITSANGVDWSPVAVQPPGTIAKIFGRDSTVYVATYEGELLASTDAGATWTTISTAMPNAYNVAFDSAHWYATAYDGVYASTDQGQNWTNITGTFNSPIALLVHEGRLLVGLQGGGIRYTDDVGQNWKNGISALVKFPDGNGLLAVGDILVATGAAGNIRTSVNNGTNWPGFNTGLVASVNCTETTVFGDWLYTACDNGLWRRPLSELPMVSAVSESINDLYPAAPNPTDGLFRLKNIAPGTALTLYISDLHNRQIFAGKLFGGEYVVDLTAQPNGVYLVKAFDGEKWSFSRVVKQ